MAGNVINEILYVSVSVYVFVFVRVCGKRVMIYSSVEAAPYFL